MTPPGREVIAEANRRLAGILAATSSAIRPWSARMSRARWRGCGRCAATSSNRSAAAHGGRLFKTTGDGFLVEFASAVQALRCAIAIQEALRAQADGLRLRIGVHQGEVVPEGDDLLGDGVIIAARLEPLAEPAASAFRPRARGRRRQDGAGGGRPRRDRR